MIRTRTICAMLGSLGLSVAAIGGGGGNGITLGLLQNDPGSYEGYTLFTHLSYPTTYLIDHDGNVVNTWTSAYPPGNSQYLRDGGRLLRTADSGGVNFFAGGDAGTVELFDWDGTIEWSFTYSDASVRAHHDIAPLPNGNILMIAWELRTKIEATAAGRNPANTNAAGIWPEHIIEVVTEGKAAGTIVWEWHAWDHLIQDFDPTKANFGVVGDHPELIDVNIGGGGSDWMHSNAIDYHVEFDQIVMSSPYFDEVWILDHSTTTAEAAGHTGGNSGMGGDLLYRWGNPANYDRGGVADQRLFGQHNIAWIEPGLPGAGNLLVFNNGVGRPGGAHSSIDEIAPPVDGSGNYAALAPGEAHGPDSLVWTYEADPASSFYASFISGTQRQPNGNTLVCSGPTGLFFEVTPAGDRVWVYQMPVSGSGPQDQGTPPGGGATFRAERYGPDHASLIGQDLTPGWPIEIYPCTADFDNDGTVGFNDLLSLLSRWAEPGGIEDVDQSGQVGFEDLVTLLSAWGPCS